MSRVTQKRVAVRPMTEDDLPGVLAIDRGIWGANRALSYADPVDNYLGGTLAMSWVAEVDDEIAGFLLGRFAEWGAGAAKPKAAWIELLGILPDYRHRGIAGELVKAFIGYCRDEGVSRVNMLANRSDAVLEGFLSFMGFKPGNLINYSIEMET